jgi:hypothetical protein
MFIHASRLRLAGVAALLVWSIGGRSDAAAQGRFELLGQDPVAAVTGLTVFTIRDRVTAGCYTLFALEPAQSAPGPAGTAITEEPTDNGTSASHKLLKDAIAERNQDRGSQNRRLDVAGQYETLRQRSTATTKRRCGSAAGPLSVCGSAGAATAA